MEEIKLLFGANLLWCCVSAEEHQDGTPHLHAVWKLKKRRSFSGAGGMAKLDALTGKHGDYRKAEKLWAALGYVAKKGEYTTYGIDVESALSSAAKKTSTADALAVEQKEGGPEPMAKRLRTLRNANPGFYLMHRKKIQDFASEIELEKQQGEKPSGTFGAQVEEDSEWNHRIMDWLNKNMLVERPHKQKQLWLYGPTNIGKTTLITQLDNLGIRIYRMPYDNNWFDSYANGAYDLIIFDEYGKSNTYPVHKLNQWLEGAVLPVCRRGQAPLLKMENLPMIVLSNHSPEEVYSKYAGADHTRLDPLRGRLDIVHAEGDIRIISELDDSTSDDEAILSGSESDDSNEDEEEDDE